MKYITTLIAVIAAAICIGCSTASAQTTQTNNPLEVFGNLRILNAAKQQWALKSKPATNSWPSKQDISRYIITKPSGDGLVTSLASEVYIVNRADRPVVVYFPKDTQIGQIQFKEGALLTMDDLKHIYDDSSKKH
jgi:hypothetical protein